MEVLNIGSVAFILMGVVLALVSFRQQAWCDYGRETGLLVACFLIISGVTRLADSIFLDFDSRKWNSIIGVAFTAILINLVMLHVARHWYLKHPKNSNEVGVRHAKHY